MGFTTAFGAIGVAAGATAGAGAVVAGMAITAVVGAAIGGLAAAVTGGDIGKGMLFGAVGGLAMGFASGIVGGMFGTAGGAVAGPGAGQGMAVGSSEAAVLAADVGRTTIVGGSGAAGQGAGGVMGKLSEVALEGTINTGGQMLMGMSAEDQAADLAKAKLLADNADRELKEKEMALSHEVGMKDQPHPNWDAQEAGRNRRHAAEMVVANRQIDEPIKQAKESRERMSGSIMAMGQRRKGVLQGTPASVQEQIFNNSQGINPEAPTSAEGTA